MTYSIVARDPDTGQMGVAVQSHWFSVGSVVTWAGSGVGAVATQAFAERSYGPRGLELMREGISAPRALQDLLAADEQMGRRQVAMVDALGYVAAHTGDGCLAEAGHIVGDGFSVQANMMLRDTVPDAMATVYASTSGDLVDRLLAALDAAEAQGGDIRGRQSAAILVVSADADAKKNVVDVRVDDHPDPLAELRRLVVIDRAYARMNEGDEHLARGETDEAAACYEAAQTAVPSNVEFTFWRGVTLAKIGRLDEAKTFIGRAFLDSGGDWRELLRRLSEGGLVDEATYRALS